MTISGRLPNLHRRAALLRDIRQFFAVRGVMEVDVPVIGRNTVPDPHISSIGLTVQRQTSYLQTSPEFFMKRLLAQGAGDIYYLGKAFRDDECSKKHNPEFTMLEWYRVGMDDHGLMQDITGLLLSLAPGVEVEKRCYGEVFSEFVGIDPHLATAEELEACAKQKLDVRFTNEPKSFWLDLLFSHIVEPKFTDKFTLVFDYPACQCALAKLVDVGEYAVARRFEVFWQGHELANGYWELTDPKVQRQRFEDDQRARQALGIDAVAPDEKFLEALETGIPECAGVALGVDRLLMCLLQEQDIRRVLPFSFEEL